MSQLTELYTMIKRAGTPKGLTISEMLNTTEIITCDPTEIHQRLNILIDQGKIRMVKERGVRIYYFEEKIEEPIITTLEAKECPECAKRKRKNDLYYLRKHTSDLFDMVERQRKQLEGAFERIEELNNKIDKVDKDRGLHVLTCHNYKPKRMEDEES